MCTGYVQVSHTVTNRLQY